MKRAILLLAACGGAQPAPSSGHTLRVLTLNVQVDGHDQLPAIARTIEAASPDVVFLQECTAEKCGAPLGKLLGFKHVQQGDDTATLSRWPITPEGFVMPPGAPPVRVKNLHLFYKPYQPYQLLHIPYEDTKFVSTADEAIAEARAIHQQEVDATVAALAKEPRVVVGGDFNEPSHLDWTAPAVAAKLQPTPVEWPSTKAFVDAGYTDAYRALYPDVVAHPGLTWTPTTRRDDPKDHHDRIDFLFERGLTPTAVQIVGENKDNADIVVAPYPTDHRGVVATFALP